MEAMTGRVTFRLCDGAALALDYSGLFLETTVDLISEGTVRAACQMTIVDMDALLIGLRTIYGRAAEVWS